MTKFVTSYHKGKEEGRYYKLIELNKIYKFKEEFCKELGIPNCQVERRLNDLIDWLSNFYEFEFKKGRPYTIVITEIIGDYQPMPRKLKSKELTEKKKKDYETFTIAALTPEYKPNSKTKIAREAMYSFGTEVYGHTNVNAVVRRYVKEPFNQYGETNNISIWVRYPDYEPMDKSQVEEWRKILREEHIGEEEASNAFYRHAEGEDISKEISYFTKARDRFKEKYHFTPLLVKEWRLKRVK